MVTKEIEVHKNAQSNKDADDEMINSKVTSLIKKEIANPSNGAANASSLSATSDATQVTTSALASKRIKETRNRDNLARRSFSWIKGI